jgi:hypothetical protein
MKSSPIYSPFTALTLKVVGVIMILSSMLDYIFLAASFNPQREWQIGFMSQLVDRGIIPMIGIALLLLGYLVDYGSGGSMEQKSSFLDLRFWALLLSCLLGLMFLLLVPLYINNISQQSNQAIAQIDQKTKQAQAQLDAQTKQVNDLVKNPQGLAELEKTINSGKVQGQQLAQLQALREQLNKFKQDPKSLTAQVEAAKTRILNEKIEAENQAKSQVWKMGIRTSLSSLLFAIGYIIIGWTGLRGLGGS